jgi:hypothetical protein
MNITDFSLADGYKVLGLVAAWGLFLAAAFRLWGNCPITRTGYRWGFFYVPMVLARAGLWYVDLQSLGFQMFVAGGAMLWVLKPLEKFLFGETGNFLKTGHHVAGADRDRRRGGPRGRPVSHLQRSGPAIDQGGRGRPGQGPGEHPSAANNKTRHHAE